MAELRKPTMNRCNRAPRPHAFHASRLAPEICFLIATVVDGVVYHVRAITNPTEVVGLQGEVFTLTDVDGIVFRLVADVNDATFFGNWSLVVRIGQVLQATGRPFGTRPVTTQLREELVG